MSWLVKIIGRKENYFRLAVKTLSLLGAIINNRGRVRHLSDLMILYESACAEPSSGDVR